MRVGWGVLIVMATQGLAAQELLYRAGEAGRLVRVRDGRVGTAALLAGDRRIAASGPEFRLCLGEQATIVDSTVYTATVDDGIACRADGLPDVLLRYAADDAAGVVRKVVTVTNTTAEPLLLRWAETESLTPDEPITFAVDPGFPQYGDWGQPVYTAHLYFGIEFPAARTTAVDGALQAREYCGTWLRPGEAWESHPVIVGAAPDGDVERAFLAYVERLSPFYPRVPRTRIYWNGFRVVKPPDRLTQGLAQVERARRMREATGFTFDAWTYDAGFDMYRADGLFIPQEPEVWPRTREALAPLGTPLGFWTSFSCIFDVPTHAWGATQGYGLQHDHAYCLAEPTYYAAISDRLAAIVSDYGMMAINFDGMYPGQGFGCNQPGHGHLVGEGDEAGVYGTYAVVANKMRIFRRLRAIQPEICLDLFICAEWASPWWLSILDGVHTVPGDTVASELPSPWLRDALITVRDEQVWDLARLHRQFPLYAMDLYGNQVRSDHLIDGIELTGEAMAARWEDELVMATAARGAIGNHIVCCDLNTLAESDSGLAFLGQVGHWLRANEAAYRRAVLLGGEPRLGQPYGYAHGDGQGRCIVGLRNPGILPQAFELPLDETLDLGMPGPYQVTRVYPYRYTWPDQPAGASLTVPLADYEVTILEIRSLGRRFAGLPEGRWTAADGRIQAAGPDPALPEPRCELAQTAPDQPAFAGTVTVPAGCDGELQAYVLPPGDTLGLKPNVTVDGATVEPAVHYRNRGGSVDAWLLVPLAPGEHDVSVDLGTGLPTRFEAWLRLVGEREFSPVTTAAPDGLLPLPAGMAGQVRGTWPALPACHALDAAPLPPGTVLLGDRPDRCVRAVTGWGRVGWNQSCWDQDDTLRVTGRDFAAGLGAHAPGRFEFVLDGTRRVFRAIVGVHPIPLERRHPQWPKGSVVFVVRGDDRELYRSPRLMETDGGLDIAVDITGVRLLTLAVEDAGDGMFDDLATWGDARVE